MALTTSELIDIGLAHLGRFAFFTRDNPFLSSRAGVGLARSHRAALTSMLDGRTGVEEWLSTQAAQRLLSSVRVGCVPREVQAVPRDGEVVVGVQSVHAFLHAPVFWWLVSNLWCITVGRAFDPLLPKEVIGFRLHPGFIEDPSRNGWMFRSRSDEHSQWRAYASTVSAEFSGEVLAANTIDMRDFFYSISATPSRILKEFGRTVAKPPKASRHMRVLTALLDHLHERFARRSEEVRPRPSTSVGDPLPVGAPSSQILANMVMSIAMRDLREATDAQGIAAYADDLIVVTRQLPEISEETGAYFRRLGIVDGPDARLQSPSTNAIAVLRVGLEKSAVSYSRSSESANVEELALGAGSDWDPYIERQLTPDWDGRLRTVLRAPYRRDRIPRELVREIRQLVDDIRVGLGADDAADRVRRLLDDVDDALFLELRPYWTELLVAAIAALGSGAVKQLSDVFTGAADAIEPPPDTGRPMRQALQLGLDASWIQALAQALAVSASDLTLRWLVLQFPHLLERAGKGELPTKEVVEYARRIRRRRLVPAAFVAVPLAEFTNWPGELIGPDAFDGFMAWARERTAEETVGQLVDLLPRAVRFVPLHETCLAVHLWAAPGSGTWLETAFTILAAQPLIQQKSVQDLKTRALEALRPAKPRVPRTDDEVAALRLRFTMPSMLVSEDQLEALITKDRRWLGEIARQSRSVTDDVVRSSVRRKANVVVLPEWAVVPQQLSWLMAQAKRAEMLVVAGQAPAIDDGVYSNRVWTGIPIRDAVRHRACLVPPPREKRFLSPAERDALERAGVGIAAPVDVVPSYRWRGMTVASLICFEFADIGTRDSLRATADLLTVSSLNRDWRYFDAVQEATTRDNYCLTVCVNTGSYPGTRIMRPTTSEKAVVASVHGSDDPTIVSRVIDMTPIVAARASGRRPKDVLTTEPGDDTKLSDYKALPPS